MAEQRNQWGQLIDAQGNVINEFGPNAGKTAAQINSGALSGGAGSSTVFDSATGRMLSTTTPDNSAQQTQQEIELQNNQARLDQEAAATKARLAQEAEARRLDQVRSLYSSTGSSAPVTGGINPNEEAARAASFARAKDAAGQNAIASLKALEDVMAGRGLRGSSIEADGTADIIMGGAGQIGEHIRSQMIGDANRAAQVADRDYAGAVTQRGQDMQRQQSLLSLLGGSLY
jgi:hypothetical protein